MTLWELFETLQFFKWDYFLRISKLTYHINIKIQRSILINYVSFHILFFESILSCFVQRFLIRKSIGHDLTMEHISCNTSRIIDEKPCWHPSESSPEWIKIPHDRRWWHCLFLRHIAHLVRTRHFFPRWEFIRFRQSCCMLGDTPRTGRMHARNSFWHTDGLDVPHHRSSRWISRNSIYLCGVRRHPRTRFSAPGYRL